MKSGKAEQFKRAPLVSIGLPTYNGDKRIGSTILAILNQNYPNLEVIISDNCSSDTTEAVCTELCKKNKAIHYFRQKENIGIISNYEFVLRQASGDFFMWVADDDSLESGILQKYVDFLVSHSDYSLVSGEIRYWSDTHAVFDEKDFGMEHDSANVRVVKYYSKVKHGAIFYGLMPIDVIKKITLRNRMGEDWHAVAKVAYQGKIKMLECIGYHKKLNGSSKTLKHYAKLIGAPWFSANFPHAQIAIDAFSEIMTSPIYKKSLHSRLTLALSSMGSVLFNHYCKEYPFIIGGKIVRFFGFEKNKEKIVKLFKKKAGSLIAAIDVLTEL